MNGNQAFAINNEYSLYQWGEDTANEYNKNVIMYNLIFSRKYY